MTWTEQELQKLRDKGFKIDDNKNSNCGDIAQIKPKTKIEKISVEKNTIEFILMSFKQKALISDYESEHKFDEVRRYRFDWVILDLKLGIEYEGLFSEKSRHTSKKGYTGDCTKYNHALVQGWRILRYTAMNYQDLEADLNKIIEFENLAKSMNELI